MISECRHYVSMYLQKMTEIYLTCCKEQYLEAKCGWKEHGASWLPQSLQGPRPACGRTWRKIGPICLFFYTLDKSKVDNGAEIVIKMIMKNSPILNHPEICGHDLVSQVLWLGCWIFDNITASIYIQKFLKVFLVALDDLYGNATYHVDELRALMTIW